MSQILLIRHAIAEDREEAATAQVPDEQRRLTEEGRKKMRGAAIGLQQALPHLALLATSPLRRAVETADIVAAAYGGLTITETGTLSPGRPPEALAAWLAKQDRDGVMAVVGHEPGLSEWIGWALTGDTVSPVEMKKGAACLIEFPGVPACGTGLLRWLLPPRVLRQLGNR